MSIPKKDQCVGSGKRVTVQSLGTLLAGTADCPSCARKLSVRPNQRTGEATIPAHYAIGDRHATTGVAS